MRELRQNPVKACWKFGFGKMFILLALLPLMATVASVPTSVLAEDAVLAGGAKSVISSSSNDEPKETVLSKVKRSSPNTKERVFGVPGINPTLPPEFYSSNKIEEDLSNKSSPEVMPLTFNNKPAIAPQSADSRPYSALPSNGEIMAAIIAAAASSKQLGRQQQKRALLARNRGQQPYNAEPSPYRVSYPYDVPYEPAAGGYYGGGVWSDAEAEPEPVVNYVDLQDYAPEYLSNMPPAVAPLENRRHKVYDNLQNLLNTEAYLESVPLTIPLPYSSGGSFPGNKYADLRLKRDNTKLTPADMLALVALVEAGERARKEPDVDVDAEAAKLPEPDNVYLPADDLLSDYNNGDIVAPGSWMSAPAPIEYFSTPTGSYKPLPKYDVYGGQDYNNNNYRANKYNGGNRYGNAAQRKYMLAGNKKKRAVGKPNIGYAGDTYF